MRAALLLLLALPIASALSPGVAPAPAATGPLDLPSVDQILGRAFQELGNVTGDDVRREDVRIGMELDFRKLDFDALGVVFGGGTFEAQGRLAARVEMRAVAVGRFADMLRERQLPVPAEFLNRTFLTADAFRASLAGEALAAFEQEQQRRIEDLVAQTFPNMTVLSSRFAWSNTDPARNRDGDRPGEPPRLTEPPIAVDLVLDVQYLQRARLVDILDELTRPASHLERTREAREEAALERLKAENAGAFYEQSAFGTLGITQLIPLEMPAGWDLALDLRLPAGYTIEYASPDVEVADDLQSARTAALAGKAGTAVSNPVALSLSNRFMVSVALLLTMLVVGMVLRAPVLLLSPLLRPGRRAMRRARKAKSEAREKGAG